MDQSNTATGKQDGPVENVRSRQSFQSAIPEVPVTVERPLFMQPDDGRPLPHIGTARANMAATHGHPQGTNKNNWAERHQGQSVLQQHCEFFDRDRDGIIWPLDTFRGFYALGFHFLLSVLSMVIIHSSFSYPTVPGYLPDPFFRIYLRRIHRDKHGSDSGTYDNEGRFAPQKFEDMFAKYCGGKEYMTWDNVMSLMSGQRVFADPVGASAALFEWGATYILLWPEDGKMHKEDVRRVYDGSIFYDMAAARRAARGQ
ncbi:hypothetical protein E4U54_008223 [Claviceps lovelessii]|nr:hypothetical protein E4U54_008223 [Claviceps lovelessii]